MSERLPDHLSPEDSDIRDLKTSFVALARALLTITEAVIFIADRVEVIEERLLIKAAQRKEGVRGSGRKGKKPGK